MEQAEWSVTILNTNISEMHS